MRYYNLGSYFREKYGKRLQKICIDGHFGCPNRDGTCGVGGCIYCGERGAGEHIDATKSIAEQVEASLLKFAPDDLCIAYFQNFTNTYADVKTLKERYDAALVSDRIRVLAIATRPDCIDRERAELIASYMGERDVWVELGLQTASDDVARVINRGYKTEVFLDACKILEEYGIPYVVHIIAGLPCSDTEETKRTIDLVASLHPFGVKLHSIYVMKNTALEAMYESGAYTPPSLDEFVECAVYLVGRMPKDTVIHRLCGNCQPELLVAPDWNANKNEIHNRINRALEGRDIIQGQLRG